MTVEEPDIDWPSIKPKKGLKVQTVLENQVYVIDVSVGPRFASIF
jgi:hypothetical protein